MQFLRTLFRRCRTYNAPSHLHAGGSQLTQTIAYIAAAGLVLSSCGFGAVFAWTTGITHGPLLAALMVMMAIALELAKPLAVSAAFGAFRSWAIVRGIALSLLAIVAVCYSLAAELQLVAGSRGDLVAKRELAIEQRDDRRDNVKAARTELAALAPSRTVAESQADITKLLAANPKANNCRNEIMGNATQRRVCPQVAALNGEIGRAERRAELEAIIRKDTAQSAPGTVAKQADPGGAALATYLAALGFSMPAGALADWLVLLPVLALECGAALAGLLVQSVSGSAGMSVQTGQQTASQVEQIVDSPGQQTAAQTQPAPATALDSENPIAKPRAVSKPTVQNRAGKRRLGQVGSVRKSDAEARILDTLKDHGGKLDDASVRGIAQLIGGKKSTVHSALAGLVAAGVVARMGSELVLQAAQRQ